MLVFLTGRNTSLVFSLRQKQALLQPLAAVGPQLERRIKRLRRRLDPTRSSNQRRDFSYDLNIEDRTEKDRRTDVFAQAWLFRVAQLVSEFASTPEAKEKIDSYISENYGDIPDLAEKPADAEVRDYDDILSGMKAANEVALHHAMEKAFPASLLDQKPAQA